MQSHIRKVYACLAVTCHLRFWQNDRDLLRGAAVTRRWNGYRNSTYVTQHLDSYVCHTHLDSYLRYTTFRIIHGTQHLDSVYVKRYLYWLKHIFRPGSQREWR